MPVRLTILSANGAEARFVEFDARRIRIGRDSDCDLRLPFPAVSGHHCTIFSEDGERYLIRDDGSTNGTRLNGALLTRHKPELLRIDACVTIAGFRIDIDTNPLAASPKPIAQTGTLVRMMLSDTMTDAEADQASISVLSGPGTGRSVLLPDIFETLTISDEPSAILQVPGLATPLKITPEQDGFALEKLPNDGETPGPASRVTVNGHPLGERHHLRSEDRIEVGRVVLRFFDPLEKLLLELDEKHPVQNTILDLDERAAAQQDDLRNEGEDRNEDIMEQTPKAAAPSIAADDASTEYACAAPPPPSWSPLEIVLIGASLAIVTAVGYLFFLMLS